MLYIEFVNPRNLFRNSGESWTGSLIGARSSDGSQFQIEEISIEL